MKIYRVVFLSILLVLITNCPKQKETTMNLSLKEIKTIAIDGAKSRGYDLSEMDISIDKDNRFWKTSIMKKNLESSPELAKKIKGKEYIVVYLKRRSKPNEIIAGGELYVFVEGKTGEILLILAGK